MRTGCWLAGAGLLLIVGSAASCAATGTGDGLGLTPAWEKAVAPFWWTEVTGAVLMGLGLIWTITAWFRRR